MAPGRGEQARSIPAGASPVAHLAVRQAAESIRTMQARGAGKIARTAAKALADHAMHLNGGASPDAVVHELERAGRELVATRPTAISLRVAVNVVLGQARGARARGASAADVKRVAYESGTRFAHESLEAVQRVAARAAEWLEPGSTVLTHCHSVAAVETLKRAHAAGKAIRAVCTETRPWFQGHITARQLREGGVDTTFIVDSAAFQVMREGIAAVVVGADTVTAAGSIYNKVGTASVALAAKDLGIPFYVAAESYKFSPFTLRGEPVVIEERPEDEVLAPAPPEFRRLGVRVRNPVFDETPGRLVTRLAAEDRALEPGQCREYILGRYGDAEGWI